MMSPKHYKNKGMILTDVILAFSVVTIFVVIIVQSSLGAREIFDGSKEKNLLLDIYEQHREEFDNLLPYESKSIAIITSSTTVNITGRAQWYGNERVETIITIGNKLTLETIKPYAQENNKYKGRSLCSVDIGAPYFGGQNKNISIQPITLPIDPLLPLTDIEIRNNIVYISADSTRANDPDLLIFNIASTTAPTLLYTLNTGPGISSLVFVENKIFAAVNSTAAQLHVIQIQDNFSPTLMARYTLALPSTTTLPTTGTSIDYYAGYILLGTAKWDGKEVVIFKIENDGSLLYQSGYEVSSKINDIFSVRDKTYIAASAIDQLILLDMNNFTNPQLLSSFQPSGWQRQEGKVISFFEDSLIFGRTAGGFDIRTDHELFQSTPSSLSTPPAAFNFPITYNMPGGVYGIVVNRSKIFIVTREAGRELQIFDSSLSRGPQASYGLPVAPQKLVCDNDRLYILAASAPIIYVLSFK